MALDKNCKDLPYIAGRMIAITEHYAGKHFGPGTLSNMFTNPANGVNTFLRHIDTNDEYYQELKDIELPVTIPNEVVKGQLWIGYYHQKAEYEDTDRGGFRPNAGRPETGRTVKISITISPEAAEKISKIKNKSEYIDRLIRKAGD
jgi:hypothetical protein